VAMILVTGATGNIGGALVKMLAAASRPVRVLARDPAKAKAAIGDPVEIVKGDLTQPETFASAFDGVEKAFFVGAAADGLAAIGGPFFDAAKKAGTKHVVAVSSGTILIDPPVMMGRWHLAMEERLKATGLAWTMLRPGGFASNALRWAGMIRTQGAVFAPHGDARSAPIDPRDIAAVGFTALTTPGHEGKSYPLTGSGVVTTREQVDIVSKAIGKATRFVEVPEEGARANMMKSGMPEVMVSAIMELVAAAARAKVPFKTDVVREITGKEARTFEDWARDNAAAFD
jgi:uncharacterized protein YbjT (DUF2867 family)